MTKTRQRASARRLHVGTSGWVYPDWVGRFYPEDLTQRDWLDHYQRHYRTVELNVTFYRLPPETVFHGWAARARTGFRFALKGPRTATHYRRLRDVADIVTPFLARSRVLGEHLGPILWQLPPGLGRNDGLLVDFIRQLPGDLVHAFEFRHAQWFAEPVYEILREHEAAFVIWHMPDRESPVLVTSPHVYLRFHGTTSLYGGAYTRSQLARWARHIRTWLAEGRHVWAYFNNDVGAQATVDARRLIEQATAPQRRSVGAEPQPRHRCRATTQRRPARRGDRTRVGDGS